MTLITQLVINNHAIHKHAYAIVRCGFLPAVLRAEAAQLYPYYYTNPCCTICAMFDVVLVVVKFVYLVLLDVPIAFLVALFKRKTIPNFSNDIVLITGAAQGIGKELAIEVRKQITHVTAVSVPNENSVFV